eukprot:m.67402 g.67402  ORF g.67402 m.67402 type:complete len:1011 (+) comp11886_c0_seq2:196-3228(+)
MEERPIKRLTLDSLSAYFAEYYDAENESLQSDGGGFQRPTRRPSAMSLSHPMGSLSSSRSRPTNFGVTSPRSNELRARRRIPTEKTQQNSLHYGAASINHDNDGGISEEEEIIVEEGRYGVPISSDDRSETTSLLGRQTSNASNGFLSAVSSLHSFAANSVSGIIAKRRVSQEKHEDAASVKPKNDFYIAVLFGFLNSIVLIPTLVAYAQIVFRDDFYGPYRPVLTKLLLASSILHQIVFTSLSSMRFAVGQVDDAAIIFLSRMATIIADILKDDCEPEEVLATTLVWLSIATTALGISLWITGRLRLAGMVQYIPMPVIGGYLAYLGLYSLEAGLSTMTGKDVESIAGWRELLHPNNAILSVPGVLCGILLLVFSRKAKSVFVFPVALLIIPTVFYIILYGSGGSLAGARKAFGTGWVGSLDDNGVKFWESWQYFKFNKLHLSKVIPRVMPTWVMMYFVMAFSSCLDVAALGMELGCRMDFNRELRTVGISNCVNGLFGGFTGSYVFAQTVFSLRAGVSSVFNGIVIILGTLGIFFSPIALTAYVPKFFFGSILAFIAFDLLLDWLWLVRKDVPIVEYLLIIVTFVAIVVLDNLEYGIVVGLSISVLSFVILYAGGQFAYPLQRRSRCLRGFYERHRLEGLREAILPLRLQGFIFFGSAVRILKDVEHYVLVPKEGDDTKPDSPEPASPRLQRLSSVMEEGKKITKQNSKETIDQDIGDVQEQNDNDALQVRTLFVVLDFSMVTGLDATAARTCFATLFQALAAHRVQLLFAGTPPHIKALLTHNGIIEGTESEDSCIFFNTVENALEHCEDVLLSSMPSNMSVVQDNNIGLILSSFVSTRYQPFPTQLPLFLEKCRISSESVLNNYFELIQVNKGTTIYKAGDTSNVVFFIQHGTVEILEGKKPRSSPGGIWTRLSGSGHRAKCNNDEVCEHIRATCRAGAMFGELGFILNRPRNEEAIALSDCSCYRLTRKSLDAMREEHTFLAASVLEAMLVAESLTRIDSVPNIA